MAYHSAKATSQDHVFLIEILEHSRLKGGMDIAGQDAELGKSVQVLSFSHQQRELEYQVSQIPGFPLKCALKVGPPQLCKLWQKLSIQDSQGLS